MKKIGQVWRDMNHLNSGNFVQKVTYIRIYVTFWQRKILVKPDRVVIQAFLPALGQDRYVTRKTAMVLLVAIFDAIK